MRFDYLNPVNLVFGAGAVDRLGETVKARGSKALLVTGRGSAKKSGLLDRVQRILTQGGVASHVFDRVTPNPTTTVCVQGAETFRAEGCEVVVGLGGGSAMDAAKAVAFAVNNGGPLSDYIFGRRQQEGPVPPIILVPTTCGTGSEGNSFAVLTDPATGDKKSLRVPAIFAQVAIVDPSLMSSLPPKVLAEAGFDAMCHLMEAHLARNAQPMTDLMSLGGLARSQRSLAAVFEGRGSADDWANLTWASLLGGMSIGPGCVVAPHALEHPLSGRKETIPHARGLSAICPAVYERTLSAAPKDFLGRFDTLARILGGTGHGDFVEIIVRLIGRLGLKESLTSLGLSADDVPWLTANAAKVSGPGLNNHPVVFDEAAIADIYRQSL